MTFSDYKGPSRTMATCKESKGQLFSFQPVWFFNWGGGGVVTNPGYSYILIGIKHRLSGY